MEAYRTEEEQVEALKRWWQENGRSTVIAVAVALSAAFGWQGWQRYQEAQAADASTLFTQLMEAAASVEEGDEAGRFQELASTLREQFPRSTYAQFAALHEARVAVAAGRSGEAEGDLRWVLSRADTGSDIHQVAQLRLARVLADRGQTDEALTLLQAGAGYYRAATALARGDILLQAQREAEALAAYRQAQALLAEYPGQLQVDTLAAKLQLLSARADTEQEAE